MKRTILPALLLAAGAGPHLHGATPGGGSADSGADRDSMKIELGRVEIVAANRATARTPVAFTNVGKRELLGSNDGRDMTHLLQMTPSVTVSSDAGAGTGYTSMRIRGTDGSRINVSANGVPINNPESHNVYWVNMPDLASSVSSVQVQRGAGTSANGAGAFGASVNMVTDAPSEEPYAELSGAYGAYRTNRQTLRAGTGLIGGDGGHWSFDARLSHIGSAGYIERASTELWSYFGQAAYSSPATNVRLLAFGGKERTYMAWDYASKEQMARFGRRYNPCGEYTADNGERAYYPDQYDNFVQHHLQLLIGHRLSGQLRLNATLHLTADDGYYDQYKTRRTLEEYGLHPFAGPDGETISKSDLIRLKNNENLFGGGQLTLSYLHGRWNAVGGAAFTAFRGHHFGQVKWVRNYVGPIDPLQRYYDNHGRKQDANLYVRATFRIDSRLSAYADLQYRHIHYTIRGASDNWDFSTSAPGSLDVDRRWNFFNPKLGIDYSSGPHRAFLSWAVAQKEPTRDNFTDGDPAHRPESERLDDFEAAYSFNHRILTLGVNLYCMLYRDQLVATGELSDTGNPISVNVPDSYRAGIELQASLKPCRWFGWDFNMTLSRNRIKNFTEYIYEDGWTNPITIGLGDTPIAFSPDLIFGNTLNFTFLGADASLQSRYVGEQYMNNARSPEARLDAYFVSDLHLAYTFRHLWGIREMRLGLSVYNLFNEKYFSNGYAGAGYSVVDGEKVIYRYAGYAAQAPAHVMATATLRF